MQPCSEKLLKLQYFLFSVSEKLLTRLMKIPVEQLFDENQKELRKSFGFSFVGLAVTLSLGPKCPWGFPDSLAPLPSHKAEKINRLNGSC